MENEINIRHIVDIVFIIALLFGFVFSAILIIALGASIYQRSVDITEENSESRTAYSYIMQKVRQNDESGSITQGTIGGVPALVFQKDIDGESYTTFLYVYKGYLMEVMTNTGTVLSPKSGQRIIQMERMDFVTVSPTLLQVFMTYPDGAVVPIDIAQYSTE